MAMTGKIVVNLHKLSRFNNLAIPILAGLSSWRECGCRSTSISSPSASFSQPAQRFLSFGQSGHSLLRISAYRPGLPFRKHRSGLLQYLFLNDTEERPFNRNERTEVYRKAQNMNSASSFGSQKDFDATEVKVRHAMFPIRKKELKSMSVTFGEERSCPNAYTLKRPFIISAMSFGALGERAVRTFARGAKEAGILMNTGEGGYPKYHLAEGCDLIFKWVQLSSAFEMRTADSTTTS